MLRAEDLGALRVQLPQLMVSWASTTLIGIDAGTESYLGKYDVLGLNYSHRNRFGYQKLPLRGPGPQLGVLAQLPQ